MITMQDVNDFVQNNNEIIPKPSTPQRAAFDDTLRSIEGDVSKRDELEKRLDPCSGPITDVNATIRSLEYFEGRITDGFSKLKAICGRGKEQPVTSEVMKIAASISRQGVVNIRPVKGRPYSTPKPIKP